MARDTRRFGICYLCQVLAVAIAVSLSSTSKVTVHGAGKTSCVDRDIRLENGRDESDGRVEMCDEGEWKTVCDKGWGRQEAKVVCRQLKYTDAESAREATRACTGQGSGGIIEVIWRCSGDEQELSDCHQEMVGDRTCDHKRDAGVFCSGQRYCGEGGSLRLVNGSSNRTGRVEICRRGCWGTVCDDGWDSYDATIACQQLGFDTKRAIPTSGAHFGEGSDRPIHLSEVQCQRNDSATRLIRCAADKDGLNDCQHSQDAGIICRGTNSCDDGDVQLVGGKSEREGRVEICYNGVWGSVCADGWDEVNANVVCVQLGYGLPGVPLRHIGQVHSPVLFHNVTCNSSHSKLFQCVDVENGSIGIFRCDHVASVTCPDTPDGITMASLTSEESNTVSTQLKVSSTQQSVVVGVVGGLLVVAAVTVVSVTVPVAVLMMKRKRKNDFYVGKDFGAVDNPTYEDHIMMPSNQTDHSRDFENPLYSDVQSQVGNDSSNQPTQDIVYEGLDSEKTVINESMYDTADGGVLGVCTGGRGHIKNNKEDTTLEDTQETVDHEAVYDSPLNAETSNTEMDNDCYSALESTYSQLQPHTLKSIQQHFPPNEDEYSCLKHL